MAVEADKSVSVNESNGNLKRELVGRERLAFSEELLESKGGPGRQEKQATALPRRHGGYIKIISYFSMEIMIN